MLLSPTDFEPTVAEFIGLGIASNGLSSPQTTTSRSEEGRSRFVAQLPYISTDGIPDHIRLKVFSSADNTNPRSRHRIVKASSLRVMNSDISFDNRSHTSSKWHP